MHKKAKKFSRKLLALLMAIVMGITCFSGVLSASAASKDVKYHDEYVEYNNLAWRVLSDEQTATALLDYLDIVLADVGPTITKGLGKSLSNVNLGTSAVKLTWNANARQIKLSVISLINATIDVKLHSVDELLETIESVASVIDRFGNLLGDAGNLQLTATSGMRRAKNSSIEILTAVIGLLQKNSADYNGKDVLGQFLRGNFGLGTVGNTANLDVYKLVGDMIGIDSNTFKADPVYNLVKHILMTNTNWFTDEEKAAYNDGSKTFVFDEVLLEKMTTQLLTKINAEITYKGADQATVSSRVRYEEIKAKAEASGTTFKQAAASLGYDPEIAYTDDGNVYIFVYGTNDDGSVADNAQKVSLTKGDSLFKFGLDALKVAWKTALAPTLETLRVNYDVDRGHGSNFDNAYYYWYLANLASTTPWNTKNLDAMYAEANVKAWAADVAKSYGAADADEFLAWVKNNYEFDRDADEDSKGAWSDIDETTLFNKIRYSPLVDYYFAKQDDAMKTGPVNLYFMQTGAPNIEAFFSDSNLAKYSSLGAGLNDALVAAVKDLFVNRDNVYGDAKYPELATTGNFTKIDANAVTKIATTLTKNAAAVIEYTADSMDANILKAFHDNHPGEALSESNLEEAMLPLLIAVIGQINLNGYKMEQYIHPEDWDACKDAEGVIFVALREYLSYILPNKDYNVLVSKDNNDKFNVTLEGTILPMARDAVVYVMQGYVPVDGKDGKAYDVYKRPVDDPTTIFELLNSVVAYYGGEYTFKNGNIAKSVGAMAVGALLGVCDDNGKSLITKENTLWQNIDLVAKKLMPVLGTLQYGDAGKKGEFSSEKLIWNDIVKGVLNIADTTTNNGVEMGGVTNFIYQFLTIVSAEPIQTTPIIGTVYDFLADFVNGLFGARYSSRRNHDNQDWVNVIPARTSATPFDALLKKQVLGGTDGKNVGAIQKFICNIGEAAGYSNVKVPDSIMRGLMFAITAVQSFVPGILDSIGDHDLRTASAEFASMTVQGCTVNKQVDTDLNFTNDSIGINNGYVKNGGVEQIGRYWMQITGATIVASDNAKASITNIPSQLVAPSETVALKAHVTYVGGDDNATTAHAVITYDIYERTADGNTTKLYTGLKTNAYQYLSGEQSWRDAVYPQGAGAHALSADFKSSITSDQSNKTKTAGGYNIYSSSRTNDLYISYPEYIVIGTANLYEISDYQFNVFTGANGTFGSNKSTDGLYCYDVKTVVNDWNNGNVNVNQNNAIPVFDRVTGDILKYGLYDYSTDGGVTWSRGPADDSTGGWSESDASAAISGAADGMGKVRTHVAYTWDEAYNSGMIAAHHKNPNTGLYEYIYLQNSNDNPYSDVLSRISCRGPVDGIYINPTKMTIPKGYNYETTNSLLNYDGSTPIKAGSYPLQLAYYTNSGAGTMNRGSCTLVIGANDAADAITESYDRILDVLNRYRDQDYLDISVKEPASDALLASLSAQAAVMTPTSAAALSDQTELTASYDVVATEYGDTAYKPFANVSGIAGTVYYDGVLPGTVYADATIGKDNLLYFDEACTMPIYSSSRLTKADVTNGKDAAGKAVIADEKGVYYLLNAPHYATEWTESPNTYLDSTGTISKPVHWRTIVKKNGQPVQDKNDNGELLYEKIQYVYRDKAGVKVNSDFVWACKFPVTAYTLIPNDPDGKKDYRGRITQMSDELAWILEQVEVAINPSLAQPIFEKVSQVRQGMNNNNFDVVTYNKMTDMARTAESKYRINITYNGYAPVLDADGNEQRYTEDQIDENGQITHYEGDVITEWQVGLVAENIAFEDYKNWENNGDIEITDVSTTSTLSSIQVEEYQRMYAKFATAVVERGYNGDQIEAEIKCAAGNEYKAFTVTPATYNDEGELETPAVLTGTTATEVPFGAVEGGKLVNNGPIIYADYLWDNYVQALANAVEIAARANGGYKYKDAGTYELDKKADYTCQVTDCYTADTNLQVAEIALENAILITVDKDSAVGGTVSIDGVVIDREKAYAVAKNSWLAVDGVADEGYTFTGFAEETYGTDAGQIVIGDADSEGNPTYSVWVKDKNVVLYPVFQPDEEDSKFNVSSAIVVAKDGNGATDNIAVNGEYTITAYAQDGTVAYTTTVDMSANNNAFTLELAPGEYNVTIESLYALTRSDIKVIVTDADIDADAISIVACDFDLSGTISSGDAIIVYQNAAGNGALYCDLDGSGTVSSGDAMIVYACAAGGTMTPVEIR
ncbi:MAG: hypothetical protein J1E81_02155 [Eubacterium sp.]|nr:hypothetical protein [Eubacterium sp.]